MIFFMLYRYLQKNFHDPPLFPTLSLAHRIRMYKSHPIHRHKSIHGSSYTQEHAHTWLILYTKIGETPHTRYLSSLKVIASYHILILLTSRLINLIRILIFRPIETSVLYVIFHFHLCFWKKFWHTHRTADGPSCPQTAEGNSPFPPCGSGSLSCRTPDRFRHIW